MSPKTQPNDIMLVITLEDRLKMETQFRRWLKKPDDGSDRGFEIQNTPVSVMAWLDEHCLLDRQAVRNYIDGLNKKSKKTKKGVKQ